MKRSLPLIVVGFFFYVFNAQYGWQKIGTFSSGKVCQSVYTTLANEQTTQAILPVPITVGGITGGFCYQGN